MAHENTVPVNSLIERALAKGMITDLIRLAVHSNPCNSNDTNL